MPLTTQQLAVLRHELTTQVLFDYDHLRDELLDHYATLTEEYIAHNLLFQAARTAAWQAMGGARGIQKIQNDYEAVTNQQIRARYKVITKRLLRWPTVVITLLTATLFSYLQFVLPPLPSKLLSFLLIISPLLVMLTAWIPYHRRGDSRQKLVWRYIVHTASWPVGLINVVNLFRVRPELSSSVFGTISWVSLLVLAVLNLFIAVSLVQLTREHFSFKLT